MKHLPSWSLGIAAALMTTFALRAADEMDPEKIAQDEIRKATAEGAKPPALGVNKMIEEQKKEEEKADEDATPTPAPATKPQALKTLPEWIPPVTGFKPSPGATHWTEAGMETGQMTGTVSGAPRDVSAGYSQMVRAANKLNVSVTDCSINGAITMTIHVTSREGDERKLDLTLTPAPDGKNSLATFEFSAALPHAKPPGE